MYAQYLRLCVRVTASPRAVIRAAHRMLSRKGRTRAMRAARHAWLRSMLQYHENDRQLVRQFRL
jgi:hypothetical protein